MSSKSVDMCSHRISMVYLPGFYAKIWEESLWKLCFLLHNCGHAMENGAKFSNLDNDHISFGVMCLFSVAGSL